MPTLNFLKIKVSDLFYILHATLIMLLVSRVYRFLSFGDAIVIVLFVLVFLLNFKHLFSSKIALAKVLVVCYFSFLLCFSLFSDTHNIFFYKSQLMLVVALFMFNENEVKVSKLLSFIAFFLSAAGLFLFIQPQYYAYYDFNIADGAYFTSFGIDFPATFSLVRAASTIASSNELASFLGLFLLARAGRITRWFEVLIIAVLVLTQSRTGMLLLLLYLFVTFSVPRLLGWAGLTVVALAVLSKFALLSTVLQFSRLIGGEDGAAESLTHRIAAITDIDYTRVFPWEAVGNEVTPHTVWLWHVDQLGVIAALILGILVGWLCMLLVRKDAWSVLVGVLIVSFTDPNLMLLPTFIFFFISIANSWSQDRRDPQLRAM